MQDHLLWVAVAACVLLAVLAGLGEHRRRRRKDFDAVGFMPWQLIQVLGLIGAMCFAILAMQS